MLLEDDYSENGLMPVIDGLICWLDGRDYDGTNSVKDRINKKMFMCKNIINQKNAFVYDKSDSTIFTEFNSDENMYNLFNSDFTLCFEDQIDRAIVEYTSATHSAYPRLIHFNDFSGNSPYQLSYNGERYQLNRMTIHDSNIVNNNIFTNICINDNVSKKAIVIVKRKNTISVYLNGKKYETVNVSNNIINLERLTLGNVYNSNRTYYGKIYSFMVYNRALTEEEIQQNYEYEQSIEREVIAENITEWDIEKTSNTPIPVQYLWKEHFNGININLDLFSNNQVLEMDISQVNSGDNDPQIMLLCDNNTGGKVYWYGSDCNTLKMGNNPNFVLKLTYPVKLRVTLINNTFSLYINDVFQDSVNV